ncbi:M23 family metallopeptidase [Streptomyces beihaiensis]|uniref:M23 family metallopeptidase n=1 Tax=Streptomyces beihaiensis TaxID=2984495 RepID=A0ABT3TNP9_9ACTN|nr:M23 family metallopeptidase [Streptomyces beihaiensis]MCX3058622.1 M23 family metallopeptidase [Streptomyces beihaiensis]
MQQQPSEARALCRFLTAAPHEWPRLAPRVTEAVGTDALERIVRATLARTGGRVTVTDGEDGLIVSGDKGRVRAWALAADDGTLTALRIEPARYTPPRRPRLPAPVALAALLLLVTAWNVLTAWTAPARTAWLGDTATFAAFCVLVVGSGVLAQQPLALRGPVAAGAVAVLASAGRLPRLPADLGDVLGLAAGAALLAAATWLVAAVRLHRWKTPVSQPLLFPLEGAWYIAQGGGRLLNHHARIPEQRGALDLVQLGRYGTRTRPGRALAAYAAYGRPVLSPCDGTVTSAADTVQDQRPGTIRYQPPYGNHVFLDTGRETVKLAHLRPGSLTVATGDTVRRGQLLGEVGNTGNTTEPHLHIHAERDGVGLDLRFTDVPGRLYRGRRIRARDRDGHRPGTPL